MNLIDKRKRQTYNIKQMNKRNLPIMNVHRTCQHIYAQIIDIEGKVLVQSSSLNKDFKGSKTYNMDAALIVGENIGEKAKKLGITEVVFNRSGYIYHGKIKAIAEGARKFIKI